MYGQIIKKLRKDKKLTQKDLSLQLGFNSSSTLAMIEREERNITAESLERLSKIFNVSIDYLLGKTSEVYPGEINDMDDDFKVLYCKMGKMTKSERVKLLKMMEIFDHDND